MKIFITGFPRAGTTLVLQILNVNQDIEITYDTIHFMRFCYKKYGQDKVKLENALKMAEKINKRLKIRDQKEFNIKKFKKIIGDKKKYLTYAFLYDELMKLYTGTENWGDRTDVEWRNAKDFIEMFDDSYVINIIRDPRDLLASWKKFTHAPKNDYLDAIANCYDSMKFSLENQKIFPNRYYVLKFEELLLNPEKEIKKLCDFIGIKFNEKMINVENFKSKKGGKWDPNKHTSFEKDLENISIKPIGRWKEHLSKEDLILTELVNSDLMKQFNYELSGFKWNIEDIKKAFHWLLKSSLATESFIKVLKTGQGVQRYPQNPLDSSTWGEIIQ